MTEEKTPFQDLVSHYEEVINILNNAASESSEKFIEALKGLSDDDLDVIIRNGVSLETSEKQIVIFKEESHALAFASEMQKQNKIHRFTEITECFSIYTDGKFYLAEPMTTDKAYNDKDNFDFKSTDDFKLANPIVGMAIYENQYRRYIAEHPDENSSESL